MHAELELAFHEEGTGRPVVFLHGQPGRGSFWDPVVTALRGGVRAIVVDRPGYGETEREAVGLRDNASAVVALLDRLGLPSAAIVGHSWGGGVALALAQDHPRRVDALVLVGSIGVRDSVDRLDRLLARRGVGPALAFASLQALSRLLLRRRIVGRLAPAVGKLSPSTIRELVAGWRGDRDWRSFVVEQRAMVAEVGGLEDRLSDVRTRAVILEGERDRIAGPRTGRRLAERLPAATYRSVPGAGHLVPLEAPEAVAHALAAVLEESPSPRSAARAGGAGLR